MFEKYVAGFAHAVTDAEDKIEEYRNTSWIREYYERRNLKKCCKERL